MHICLPSAMLGPKLNKYDFHPPEVVGRGRETQLQVGEHLDKLTRLNLTI